MIRQLLKRIIDTLIKLESFFVRQDNTDSKKLLILRKDTLGDYVIFYPTLKYYRQLYPQHEITLIVSKIAESLIPKFKKSIDNFILFDSRQFSSNFFYRRNFLLNLKKNNFSTAIYPVYSREKMGDFMVWLTNAKEKIGSSSNNKKADKIYTKLINVPDQIKTEFEIDQYFIKELGADVQVTFPTIELTDQENQNGNKVIDKYNLQGKKFCIVFPGAGQSYKQWPLSNFAKLIEFISSQSITPLVCGSAKEKILADGLKRLLGNNKFIDLTGQLELMTLASLLKRSLFYVGNDTGIAHLSAAVGTPTICIIGGGHFRRFFPYGDLTKNLIVYDKTMKCLNDNWQCASNLKKGEPAPCVVNIKIEDVQKEISNLL